MRRMPGTLARERLLLLALLLAATAVAAADEPQKWLDRMNRALITLNYDGVFSHWHGGRVETLRIIHRVEGRQVMERLVSLDGSGREFIRRGSELACYLPDERRVLVEQQPPRSLLLNLPNFDESARRFYEFRAGRRARLIGKPAQLIVVSPRDEYRYGYRLWIDTHTGMPLKTQLCDGRGKVIEQVVFASLQTPREIPDSAFTPDISTAGFQWMRQEPAPVPSVGAMVSWYAMRLPPGFRMSVRTAQVIPGAGGPVEHLVYTDGIASVSVFVESHMHPDHAFSGSVQVGTSSAYSTVVDGHPVTVVGEVPPMTVRFIARSVAPPAPSGAEPSTGPAAEPSTGPAAQAGTGPAAEPGATPSEAARSGAMSPGAVPLPGTGLSPGAMPSPGTGLPPGARANALVPGAAPLPPSLGARPAVPRH